jgi:hypothetical protein
VPEASGQRFSTSAGAFTPQDYVDVSVPSLFLSISKAPCYSNPDLKNVPVGKTNAHDEYTKDMDFVDGSKAEKVLGIKYKSFEQTVVEMCKSVRERFGF